MKARASQAGFTLLEVTVTLAVIGALTKVALPHFVSTSRKAQNETEVSPMFAELHVRQAQFVAENGAYKSLGATEAVSYPTAPSPRGTPLTRLPATWQQMRIRTPESVARCAYTVMAGIGGDAGPVASTTFGFVAPPFAWYYLLARCPGAATDTYYFASSVDTAMRSSAGLARDGRTGTPVATPAPSTAPVLAPAPAGQAPTAGSPIMNPLPGSVNGNVNDDTGPSHQEGVAGDEVGPTAPVFTPGAEGSPTTTLSETCKKDPKKCK